MWQQSARAGNPHHTSRGQLYRVSSAVEEASQEECAIATVREHSSSRTQLRCSQLLSGCLVCLHVCMYGQFGQSVCEGQNVMCVKLNSLLHWSP